jgi:SAM-dependent methyltransferase
LNNSEGGMVAHYYDVFAEVYDERWGQQDYAGAELAFLRELAEDGPALEIGIGTGRVAIPLAEAGVTVVGVDPSPKMLAVLARKLAGAPHLKVEASVWGVKSRLHGLTCVSGRCGFVLVQAAEDRSTAYRRGTRLCDRVVWSWWGELPCSVGRRWL